MKKIIGLVFCLLLVSLCAFALADVAINETNFPDAVFREYVGQFDTDSNGSLSDDEMATVKEINLEGTKNCKSVAGVEYFPELETLNCWACNLPALDISKNTHLKKLSAAYNEFSKLDVSNNTELIELWCYKNNLSELDVSHNPELEVLVCSHNSLTKLDLSHNLKLNDLSCHENQIASLDVSMLTDLSILTVSGNPLTEIDTSNNPNLWDLGVAFTQISKLNISNNTGLANLVTQGSNITTVDISSNPSLVRLVNEIIPERSFRNGIRYWDWTRIISQDETSYSFDAMLTVNDGTRLITPDGDYQFPEVEPVRVTSVTLDKTKATLTRTSDKKKPTLQLTATVEPEDADDPSVEWTSSNPKVAKVDENGKVTALKTGTAVITCAAKDGSGVKAECKITVKDKLVTKITLNKKKVTIKLGKTFQLKVTKLSPANALNQKVTWKSSNTKIATVDKNGKVKAKKKGTCIITCTAKDGSGKKVTCKITVK